MKLLPCTSRSAIASGLCRSLNRQVYSAVSAELVGLMCKLKLPGSSVICAATVRM